MTTKKSPKRYDASGFVTQKIASVGGSVVTHACAYDTLGRLVSESVTNAVTSFSYDSAGNRLGSAGATPATFDYVNNRLVSVAANGAATSAVLYDAAGNVTSLVSRAGVTLSLSWNTLGQLVSVSTNGAFAESYAYDALGRRIGTTSLSTTNHQPSTIDHLYDGDQCVADTDASGNLLRAYTWGPGADNLLAVTIYSAGATNTYYAVRDRLGSVHALTDASGSVAAQFTYDAWGNVLSGTINSSLLTINSLRYLWQGGAYSAATGLYQFRARWYSPELGRWLSPDPIGLEGGLNLYEFCRNNPLNFRDPSGPRVWSERETYNLLMNLRAQAQEGGLSWAWNQYMEGSNLDFKYLNAGDYFTIEGNCLKADEFGNFVAGWIGRNAGGMIGVAGSLVGGVIFDMGNSFSPNHWWNPDADSRADILNGARYAGTVNFIKSINTMYGMP